MESTVKQRLVTYLKFKRLGQNKFEAMAGLSNGYIANLKSTPGAEKLVKIFGAAPDLNRTWLLSGEGDMLIPNEAVPVRESALNEYTTTKAGIKYYKREDGQLVMEVPVVPIAALGSPYDDFATIINDYSEDTMMVETDAVHHGHYCAFRVEGNSMDDGSRRSFEAGDVVLVRELPRDEWLPKLHINKWPFWVIVWDNCVRVKQIIAQDETSITLHSLNPSPEYCDFTLPLDKIYRLFNVVRLLPRPICFSV